VHVQGATSVDTGATFTPSVTKVETNGTDRSSVNHSAIRAEVKANVNVK
jgi:hypothetical protein